MRLTFSFLDGRYGIYRCSLGADLPLSAARFLSYTRTGDEVSIVCGEGELPEADRSEGGYVVLKLHGPFDLGVTGVLAEVSGILANEAIPIFAISTYDTDYILMKASAKAQAIAALAAAGHILAD